MLNNLYVKFIPASEIKESDIDKIEIGEMIQTEEAPDFIRRYYSSGGEKRFIVQKVETGNFVIIRIDNIKTKTSNFKFMRTGEFLDFKENRTKIARYAHTYGNSSKKKFKTETFNDPDQGKFLRVTRIS